jgi:hypothetical protein
VSVPRLPDLIKQTVPESTPSRNPFTLSYTYPAYYAMFSLLVTAAALATCVFAAPSEVELSVARLHL